MINKYIEIAINDKGIDDINYGRETTNIMVFPIEENEFESLLNAGVFNQINSQCDLLIDIYEEEEIPNNMIKKCIKIVGEANQRNTNFNKALIKALEYNSNVYITF